MRYFVPVPDIVYYSSSLSTKIFYLHILLKYCLENTTERSYTIVFKEFKIILTKRNFSDDTYTFSAFVLFSNNRVKYAVVLCEWVHTFRCDTYLENSLSSRQRSVRSHVDLRHVRRRDGAKVSVPVVDSRFVCEHRPLHSHRTHNQQQQSISFLHRREVGPDMIRHDRTSGT